VAPLVFGIWSQRVIDNKTIQFELDGKTVEVQSGETLLDACRSACSAVPTLCHDDRLDPYGGCRMCLVELEGAPRPVPACKTTVSPGMKVTSQSPKLERLRRTMAEMLLAEHKPGNGIQLDQLNECAQELGAIAPEIHFKVERTWEDRNRFLGFDPGACILCDRCVRYCDEVMQCTALEHVGQGSEAFIQPTDGASFLDTSCELCGGCIGTCPTGALYEKQAMGDSGKPRATIEETDKTRTVCTFCGVGCVLDIHTKDGQVIKISAEEGIGPNDGHLCNKGRFAWQFIHHKERLTHPLLRGEDGELHKATWDEAYARVRDGLLAVKQKYGADSIGLLASSRCTNEDVYALQKLARSAIGTNNVHSCAAT
jgi:predicted molibdopterin-dependent oxidoreductase YjgC